MKRTWRAYRIKMTTVGPVYIGSGREFSKKEYVFLSKDKVGILDTVKLYQLMKARGLQKQFEEYLLREGRLDLSQWIRQYQISTKELLPCIRYTLDCGDTVLQRGTKTSIMENIKDSYGMPFIPGSTIKGMLRTILLSASLFQEEQKAGGWKRSIREAAQRSAGRNIYLAREIRQLEVEAFHQTVREGTRKSDAVNDEMAGMIVSDSMPIPLSQIILCQRIEYHVDRGEKLLNVLRECIRPETEIAFTLTIDETKCQWTVEDIKEALGIFNDCYNVCFLSAYPNFDRLQKNHLFLGGGVGFVSKTVVYPLFGKKEGIEMTQKIFEHTKVPKNHKHYLDGRMGVSPHILKCTKYKGQVLQMGLCKLMDIQELG